MSQSYNCIFCGELSSLESPLIFCSGCGIPQCKPCVKLQKRCPACDELQYIEEQIPPSPDFNTMAVESLFYSNKKEDVVVPTNEDSFFHYVDKPTPPSNSYFSLLKDKYTSFSLTDPTNSLTLASEGIGLPNYGNSCYINCVMQIFLHSQFLWDSLLETFGSQDLLKKVREEYCKFAQHAVHEQCDAMLFCNFLFDKLGKLFAPHQQKWTITHICDTCKHESHKNQEENFWRVYPPAAEPEEYIVDEETNFAFDYDMSDCVDMQREESIEKKCEVCKQNTKHTCVTDIFNLSSNLFFNFQLFDRKRVMIYQHLNLTVDDGKTQKLYHLKGFILHRGTLQGGHYVAYMKDTTGWKLYDDSKVSPEFAINYILARRQPATTIPLLWYSDEDDVDICMDDVNHSVA